MSAYVNPASIRVDVSDLLILRDEAIRAAKEALPEAGNDFTQACNGVAVAAVVDMLCDGWKPAKKFGGNDGKRRNVPV